MSRPHGIEGISTAQLPAHHAGIVQVPAVITDGAPGALVKNLHSSGAATTSVHQADLSYREYLVKLRKLPAAMLTEPGRAEGTRRLRFMRRFFDRLDAEIRKAE